MNRYTLPTIGLFLGLVALVTLSCIQSRKEWLAWSLLAAMNTVWLCGVCLLLLWLVGRF